jgi:hypothetical protein
MMLDERSVPADADGVAELDRQWAEIEAGASTVPHEKVARWLQTWGTPDFKPWPAFGIGMSTDHTLEEVGQQFS